MNTSLSSQKNELMQKKTHKKIIIQTVIIVSSVLALTVIAIIGYFIFSILNQPVQQENILKSEYTALNLQINAPVKYSYNRNSDCLDVCPTSTYTYKFESRPPLGPLFEQFQNTLSTHGYTDIKLKATPQMTQLSASKMHGRISIGISILATTKDPDFIMAGMQL